MAVKTGAWPNSVALDVTSEEIFCIDAKYNEIYRMNYDGSHRITIPLLGDESRRRPYDLEFLPEFSTLMWTDSEGKRFVTDQLNDNRNEIANSNSMYITGNRHPYALAMISRDKQPFKRVNCSCSNAFCLNIPNANSSRTCLRYLPLRLNYSSLSLLSFYCIVLRTMLTLK